MRKTIYFLAITSFLFILLVVGKISFAWECVGPNDNNCLQCHIRNDIHTYHFETVLISDCTECHCGEPGTSSCDWGGLTHEPVENFCCTTCHDECFKVNDHTYRPPPDDFDCGLCHFSPGTPGNCLPDIDLDDFPDDADNCPVFYNPGQEDVGDGDGVGDACDNCPNTPNLEQEDTMPPGGNSDPLGGFYCGDACECEGDFEPDGDVDGTDAVSFKQDFFRKDCAEPTPCNGDFECDGDVDGTDAVKFKLDFFRKDCPSCTFSCY